MSAAWSLWRRECDRNHPPRHAPPRPALEKRKIMYSGGFLVNFFLRPLLSCVWLVPHWVRSFTVQTPQHYGKETLRSDFLIPSL